MGSFGYLLCRSTNSHEAGIDHWPGDWGISPGAEEAREIWTGAWRGAVPAFPPALCCGAGTHLSGSQILHPTRKWAQTPQPL